MQNQFANYTKQLADKYLVNASSIQELGLYNGKMGVTIGLFECYKITGKEEYKQSARELLCQLFEIIPSCMPLDFENGLTGIGWGFEYLAQQGFVGNEKNIILNEIDKRLFVAILKSRTLMPNNGIYGAGIYFVERIKPLNGSETNLLEKNKIQLATYLRDDCERLLCRNAQFVFNIPNLSLEQVNSIVYFYSEILKYTFIAIDIKRLWEYLIILFDNLSAKTFDTIDVQIFSAILNRFSQNLINPLKLDGIMMIKNKIQPLNYINNASIDSIFKRLVFDFTDRI